MVVYTSVSLLLVILLVIISPTVETEAHTQNALYESFQSSNNPDGPLKPPPHHETCRLLVDDETAESLDWGPWAYPPICIPPKTHGVDILATSKLCSFTLSNLRGGTGISLITTPDVASNLAGTIQDPDISWLERERGKPLAPSPHPSKIPYEVREIPGKGLGVIATAPISKGNILMVELPVLLQVADTDDWNYRGVLELLQYAAVRLANDDRDRLLQMARRGRGYIVDDVMKTNSFQVTIGGVQHSGLYPSIARINHECKPNCFTRYSPTTLAMEVVAYHDIAPGEELSLSYLPLNLISTQRKEALPQNWGFTCTCPLCSNPKAASISDRQRTRLSELLESLRDSPAGELTTRSVKAAIDEVEDLVEQEGLTAQIGDLYGIVSDVWVRMGESKTAKECAELAVKMQRHFAGVDNERSVRARERLSLVL